MRVFGLVPISNPLPFGDVYAGLVLWQRLGLGALLTEQLGPSRAEVPWASMAALLAVNRLVAPMPEWRMVRWWRPTALPPLIGVPVALVDDNRLYWKRQPRCRQVSA